MVLVSRGEAKFYKRDQEIIDIDGNDAVVFLSLQRGLWKPVL